MHSVSSRRCSPPTPTRTTTGVMKTWTPWRRLLSTSWRRGWRGWTCSPWSWRKVPNIVKSTLKSLESSADSICPKILVTQRNLEHFFHAARGTGSGLWIQDILHSQEGLRKWISVWWNHPLTSLYYQREQTFELPFAHHPVSWRQSASLLSEPRVQHPLGIIVH